MKLNQTHALPNKKVRAYVNEKLPLRNGNELMCVYVWVGGEEREGGRVGRVGLGGMDGLDGVGGWVGWVALA